MLGKIFDNDFTRNRNIYKALVRVGGYVWHPAYRDQTLNSVPPSPEFNSQSAPASFSCRHSFPRARSHLIPRFLARPSKAIRKHPRRQKKVQRKAMRRRSLRRTTIFPSLASELLPSGVPRCWLLSRTNLMSYSEYPILQLVADCTCRDDSHVYSISIASLNVKVSRDHGVTRSLSESASNIAIRGQV